MYLYVGRAIVYAQANHQVGLQTRENAMCHATHIAPHSCPASKPWTPCSSSLTVGTFQTVQWLHVPFMPYSFAAATQYPA